jgi:hypothetical protein
MLDELSVADEPGSWAALGFAVEKDACTVDGTRIRLAGRRAGEGMTAWSLRDVKTTELDGLPTTRSAGPLLGEQPVHPNGISTLDHVVVISPALDRTIAALRSAGLNLRRIREDPTPAGAPRQAFFGLRTTILEVVQEPPEAVSAGGEQRPAFFWGLAFGAPDLDATVAWLGDRVGAIRPAVQPGRRIATLRRSAGLSLPVALISAAPS